MSDFENELTKILEKEYSVLKTLDSCAKEKSEILANGDVDALSSMLAKEQPLAMQCKVLETKRTELLRKNKMFGKTLKEIMETSSPDYKVILKKQLDDLTNITKNLKEKNDLNNELTQSRLEFYGKMRSVLTKPAYGYNKKSGKQGETELSMIDRKI